VTDRPDTQALHQEWLLLQAQHEQYELWTLGIKLTAVLLAAFAPVSTLLLLALLALLWLQEAIFKTFQGRLGERLLRIEQALAVPDPAVLPMQLSSRWLAQRPGAAGLVGEYLRAACRPTVAFPYPLLMALALLLA
jgi:hypothetical protein